MRLRNALFCSMATALIAWICPLALAQSAPASAKAAIPAKAEADSGYNQPPKEILDVMRAGSPPQPVVSPGGASGDAVSAGSVMLAMVAGLGAGSGETEKRRGDAGDRGVVLPGDEQDGVMSGFNPASSTKPSAATEARRAWCFFPTSRTGTPPESPTNKRSTRCSAGSTNM